MTDILETIEEMVVSGKFKDIEEQVQGAVDSGIDLNRLINDALISAMDIVGKRFADGEIYVPEMLVSAKTMKLGLDIIKPLLQSGEAEHRGTVAMGTVKGDLHDIGKNLVGMMLEGAGFEVIDLGINNPVENYLEAVDEHEPVIMGMSALLTTTMPAMEKTIQAIKDSGIAVKTMVGGAPVTQTYAEKIGADGYAPDAASAVDLAKSLLN